MLRQKAWRVALWTCWDTDGNSVTPVAPGRLAAGCMEYGGKVHAGAFLGPLH